MRIAILGFGREGRSVLKFLQNRGLARTGTRTCADEIWVLDKNPNLEIPRGIKSRLGKNCLSGLEKYDLIFRSPGIPYNLPGLRKARRAGVKFSSATKLFFEELRGLARTKRGLTRKLVGASPRGVRASQRSVIIGITGTKGKGTTATLLYKIFKNAGKPALLAGNIGKSALGVLPLVRKNSIIILELSSFQLQDLEKSPDIAVVLDIFPDHQDAHLNLREYYEAKTNIARHQKPGDKIFFFRNHPLSRWMASKSRGRKIAVDENKFKLFSLTDLKIPGFHNFKNAVMAATVAHALGIRAGIIAKTVKNFRGLEHRLEFVRRIPPIAADPLRPSSSEASREADKRRYISENLRRNQRSSAIEFWNDSASTNPQTTAAAIRAFSDKRQATSDKRINNLSHIACPMSLILIAGGFDKGLSHKPLANALKNSNTKLVVLFGENKHKIQRQIAKSGARIMFVKNLKSAVRMAYKSARVISHKSSVIVLFSPGAASFDMFKNYADRGRQFKKLVKKLKNV